MPVTAESLPTQFTAYYEVIKSGITVGETKRSVYPLSEDTFIFRSETNPRGIASWLSSARVVEKSIWKFTNNEIRPLEYSYKNTSGDKIRHVKLLFDWAKMRVTNIINGDPWHMALVPGLQDKLLYQLQMMQDLASGANQLKYSVADGGRIKEYSLEILGNEPLEISLGRFATTKLKRSTDTRTTIWWCAEELRFLPIKIQQEKINGSRVTAVLYKLEGLPIPKITPAKP